MLHSSRRNRLIFLVLIIVIANPVIAVATEKVHPGKEAFEELCASCHGYDGIPNLPGTPNFFTGERLDKNDSELLQAIRKGKGDVMPPWEEVLNEQAQQNVLHYIKDVLQQESAGNNQRQFTPMLEEKP